MNAELLVLGSKLRQSRSWDDDEDDGDDVGDDPEPQSDVVQQTWCVRVP